MSGLLADLYSTIDSKKRQLKGLLSDPVETLRQGLLNFRDDQNATLNLLDNAYQVTPGSKTVLNTPEQIKGFQKQIADKGADMAFAATFIGPNAKTWDALSAKKAQDLAAQGVDPRKIWSETGTWRGPDGKWRQEIPDNKATISTNALPTTYIDGYGNVPAWKVGDVLDHKQLDNAYPSIRNIESSFDSSKPIGASYNPSQDWISYSADTYKRPLPSREQKAAIDALRNETDKFHKRPDVIKYYKEMENEGLLNGPESEFDRVFNSLNGPAIDAEATRLARAGLDINKNSSGGGYSLGNKTYNATSTTLHELQHAIQQREGWAKGGSPDAMDGLRRNYLDEKNFLTSTDEYQAANKRMYELLNNPEKYNKEGLEKGAYVKKVVDWFSNQPVVKKVEALTPIPADSTKAYMRLAGEAEARATQARIPLDAAQRRALFPEDSYDVPINQLIIRGLLE